MEQIGCKIKFIEGDGNCLFRSLADQLEGRPQDHSAIRAKVKPALVAELDILPPHLQVEISNRVVDGSGAIGT